jgi:hypothetical protein
MPVGWDETGASAGGQEPQTRAGGRAMSTKNGGACEVGSAKVLAPITPLLAF